MLVNRNQLVKAIQSAYPFNSISPEEIARIVEKTDVVFFKAGHMVYLEGAPAKYLYLVFEGAIEILREIKGDIDQLNYLPAGYVFGEDSLRNNQNRRTSARSASDTILVRIEKKIIDQIISQNPDFIQIIELFLNTYEILIEKSYHQLKKSESIIYLGRPHRFHFFIHSLLYLLLILVAEIIIFFLFQIITLPDTSRLIFFASFFLLVVLVVLWKYLEWRNDVFIFTSRRVICLDRVLLFHDVGYETPLNAIININIRKSIFGRGLNFGDLFVKTFTGVSRFKNVPQVDHAAELLDFVWKREKIFSRHREIEEFRKLVDRPDQYEEDIPEKTSLLEKNSFPQAQTPNSSLINRLFRLRVVQDDAIIYHTHWFKLIMKTFFPSAIITSLLLIILYFSLNGIVIRTHQIFQVSVFGVMLGCFFWWIYQYMDWRRDQYFITPDQIMDVDRKPFGIEDLRTAPIKNIQSIRYERKGLIGLLLNYGTVYIRVGDDELTFDHVYDPESVQQELFHALERYLSGQKREDLTEQQKHIADWITSYVGRKTGEKDREGMNSGIEE